jgi:hypothetical protein
MGYPGALRQRWNSCCVTTVTCGDYLRTERCAVGTRNLKLCSVCSARRRRDAAGYCWFFLPPGVADTRGPGGGRRRERPVVGRRACRPAGRRPGAAHGGKPAAHGGGQMLVVLTTWNVLTRHALGATGPGQADSRSARRASGQLPKRLVAAVQRWVTRARPADPARSSRSAPCWAGRSASTTSPPCAARHPPGCSRTSRPRWAPTCSWPRRSRAGQADRADLRFPPGNRRRRRQHLEAAGGRRWRRTWPRPAHDADLHELRGARAQRRRHHSADEPDCALSSTRSGELNHPPRRRSLTHVACPAQPDHRRPVAAQ